MSLLAQTIGHGVTDATQRTRLKCYANCLLLIAYCYLKSVHRVKLVVVVFVFEELVMGSLFDYFALL